ncbi:MAG: rhomboid family intramembrane serine protease [Planctomycetota bacterium]|jgi:membrane associated rhomboid family serine protease
MFIPIGTDRQSKRAPLITEGLIVVNMIVYLAGLAGQFAGWFDGAAVADKAHFDPQHVRAWQLITYQFSHDPTSVLHLGFNMLFLWVFGAPVERRLGRLGFLAFYLVGGVVAAFGHMLTSRAPVIGASGAVAGVTGAFLALFPRARIRVLVIFFIIGIFHIPALWFIGFYFAIDLLSQFGSLLGRHQGQVAYAAHLAGYAYGFTVGVVLLATGLLQNEEFDVFYLFRQARRRAAFRAATRDTPAGPWESASADTGRRLERQRAREPEPTPPPHQERRSRIMQLLEAHDTAAAAAAYRELLELDPTAVFSEQRQLDLSNQLFAEECWADAARAYELMLKHYPHGAKANEVRLILATLYTRYLTRADRARALLEAARRSMRDPGQAALADQLLAELGT